MTLKLDLDVQYASTVKELPTEAQLEAWALAALLGRIDADKAYELSVRIVDVDEGQSLNLEYRGKDYATNVLSFPFDMALPEGVELPSMPLGDLVICAPVIAREANEQDKAVIAHWAHMIVHGCLHLLGYDHIDDQEAEVMESLERDILAGLGYPDPYSE